MHHKMMSLSEYRSNEEPTNSVRRHDASDVLQGIISSDVLERILLVGVLGDIIANVMLRVMIWRGVFRGMDVNGL
jgi:hypothetical protein